MPRTPFKSAFAFGIAATALVVACGIDDLTEGFRQLGREVDAFLADVDMAVMIDAITLDSYARHATIYARF